MQPAQIKMETAKRVSPLKPRKVKNEGNELGSSSDSGTWMPKGKCFGYPPKAFTDLNHPQTSEEGGEVTEAHPNNKANDNIMPSNSDSAHKSMPQEEVPIPNKIKFELGPNFPLCTPQDTDIFATIRSQTGVAQ